MTMTEKFGTFTDPRDGKVYKTVKIGEQVWMAENLNYKLEVAQIVDRLKNELKNSGEWMEWMEEELNKNLEGSKCYNNDPANCEKYGKLYSQSCADACPPGWHIPSRKEWSVLIEAVGGEEIAGKHLKAKSGWNDKKDGSSGNGEDTFGFAALPGGQSYYSYSDLKFSGVGNYGTWRISDGVNCDESGELIDVSYMEMYNDYDGADLGYDDLGSESYSIRCIQD